MARPPLTKRRILPWLPATNSGPFVDMARNGQKGLLGCAVAAKKTLSVVISPRRLQRHRDGFEWRRTPLCAVAPKNIISRHGGYHSQSRCQCLSARKCEY